MPFSEIAKADGTEQLEELAIRNLKDQSITQAKADSVFIFIGARPYTDWLKECVLKDEKGFVLTGDGIRRHGEFKKWWRLDRDPYLLETSVPGIFAAGDVRSGAMNRVASAVGEGSMSISFVHKYLGEV